MRAWLAVLLLCVLAGEASARALRACGHPVYPPVSWVSQGRLVGLAPAVVQQLFGELGEEVEMVATGNWERCLLDARLGYIDIVVAAYRTSERQRYLAFTEAHLVADPIVLFVSRERGFAFSDWADLKGRRVGLLLGDSFGERFDRFAARHLRVERVSSGAQNFSKLALGRIDFMPIGLNSWRLQRHLLDDPQAVEQLPRPLVTEHYRIAVRRDPRLLAWLPHLERRLGELNADGSLQRLEQEYAFRYLEDARRHGQRPY